MDKKSEAFLTARDQVEELFETLITRIAEYSDQGMMDEGASLYNEATTLLEETEDCLSFAMLSELIFRGKQIETRVEAWHQLNGGSSYSLEWPDLRRYLEGL